MLLSGLGIAYFDILSLSPVQKVLSGEELVLPGEQSRFSAMLPIVSVATDKTPDNHSIFAEQAQPAMGNSLNANSYRLDFRIGMLPLRSVTVAEITPLEVVVGGHSIGILLQTEGVTVVGHSAVIDDNGLTVYPAKNAGLRTGDFVTEINGIPIHSNAQIRSLIDEIGASGNICTIRYLRDGIVRSMEIEPLHCSDSQSFRIGLYVRDNTAGVGTLTFYEPISGIFGALGHGVSNMQYGVDDEEIGSIVRAAIQGIRTGEKGSPGEKLGVFIGSNWQGSITTNGNFGIYGRLQQEIVNDNFPQRLPVALPHQVEPGPAIIYTVIAGEEIQAFEIEIVRTMPNYLNSSKGMVIEITDEYLLAATGGIVQGMSGSPIVQNGRLVGAVTHVFVNNPQRGYACFAKWMLEEAGINFF